MWKNKVKTWEPWSRMSESWVQLQIWWHRAVPCVKTPPLTKHPISLSLSLSSYSSPFSGACQLIIQIYLHNKYICVCVIPDGIRYGRKIRLWFMWSTNSTWILHAWIPTHYEQPSAATRGTLGGSTRCLVLGTWCSVLGAGWSLTDMQRLTHGHRRGMQCKSSWKLPFNDRVACLQFWDCHPII